jgi:two-component system, sensor histidine kinase
MGPLLSVANPASGRLILVIDDDELVRDGMGGILRSWGCETVIAHSAAEALTLLSEARQPPHLIISDYRLVDGKTGIEAIESVRGLFDDAIPAFH